MATLFANRVKGTAVFMAGEGIELACSASVAIDGYIAPPAAMAAMAPALDDDFGLLVEKDATNWAVYTANWDDELAAFIVATTENTMGTLTNGDAVTVALSPTAATLAALASSGGGGTVYEKLTGNKVLTADDQGKRFFLQSDSAFTVTVPDGLPVGFEASFFVVSGWSGQIDLSMGISSDWVNNRGDEIYSVTALASHGDYATWQPVSIFKFDATNWIAHGFDPLGE